MPRKPANSLAGYKEDEDEEKESNVFIYSSLRPLCLACKAVSVIHRKTTPLPLPDSLLQLSVMFSQWPKNYWYVKSLVWLPTAWNTKVCKKNLSWWPQKQFIIWQFKILKAPKRCNRWRDVWPSHPQKLISFLPIFLAFICFKCMCAFYFHFQIIGNSASIEWNDNNKTVR